MINEHFILDLREAYSTRPQIPEEGAIPCDLDETRMWLAKRRFEQDPARPDKQKAPAA